MPATENEPPSSLSDPRLQQLEHWLREELRLPYTALAPASSDASFRRYFRIQVPEGSHVVMDAPPEREDCRPFVSIAWALRDIGLNVPQVLEMDLSQGFLLLSDLGNSQYLSELDPNSVERLYGDALDALERLQLHGPSGDAAGLPDYDRALLLGEMELFREWLLQRHLGLDTSAEDAMLDHSFALLAEAALEQPRVCVHRDYHSRNLMVVEQDNPGILDFQDAVIGPITYDLVSLLRDCYIAWPRSQVEAWALDYRRRPAIGELCGEVSDEQWLRWFDLMGAQRHLKAAGIFARLWHRDGKPGYLADLPRTVRYISQVAETHPELDELNRYLHARVLPVLDAA
ncbi:phosphotransferase [Alkalilimnicola sp. S0819]|nr:phosphotransferase [Alkalilimnicola sp. S0819]MPQ16632.1 phosphotransferase [Alkalilimnicola sp. S0819]